MRRKRRSRTGAGGGTQNTGVSLLNSSTVIANGSGNVTIEGTSGNGSSLNRGILVTGSGTQITSVSGDIRLEGTGGGTSSYNRGIDFASGGTVRTGGDVEMEGSGTTNGGVKYNSGIYLRQVLVEGTNVNLTGTGATGSSGHYNRGIDLYFARVVGTNLMFRGTGGNGSSYNEGFRMVGGSLSGTLDLVGSALGTTTGKYNTGVYFLKANLGLAFGSITGTGGGGVGSNHGIYMQGGVAFGGATTGFAGAGAGSLAKAGSAFV